MKILSIIYEGFLVYYCCFFFFLIQSSMMFSSDQICLLLNLKSRFIQGHSLLSIYAIYYINNIFYNFQKYRNRNAVNVHNGLKLSHRMKMYNITLDVIQKKYKIREFFTNFGIKQYNTCSYTPITTLQQEDMTIDTNRLGIPADETVISSFHALH